MKKLTRPKKTLAIKKLTLKNLTVKSGVKAGCGANGSYPAK